VILVVAVETSGVVIPVNAPVNVDNAGIIGLKTLLTKLLIKV